MFDPAKLTPELMRKLTPEQIMKNNREFYDAHPDIAVQRGIPFYVERAKKEKTQTLQQPQAAQEQPKVKATTFQEFQLERAFKLLARTVEEQGRENNKLLAQIIDQLQVIRFVYLPDRTDKQEDPKDPPRPYLSFEEAAHVLCTDVETVERLVSLGQLTQATIDSERVITVKSINYYIEASEDDFEEL